MKIAVYYGKNDGQRSLKVMTDDICSMIEGAYPVAKIQDLKGADIILNIVIADIPKIEEARRFVGFGRQVCFFSSNVKEYTKEVMVGLLMYMHRIPLIIHSKFHYDEVLERVRAFNPVLQRKIKSNMHLVECGITQEFIPTGENDKNRWMVPYNRVNREYKNIDLHIETTNYVRAMHSIKDIETPIQDFYLIDYEDFDDLATRFDFTGYNLQYCPKDRADYIRNCQKSGMFICTSVHESFGLMYLELLAAGVVGIFLDKKWIRNLLPDYKLITDKKGLATMVASVYNDYNKASNYVIKKVAPEIHKRYSFTSFVDGIHNVLEIEYDNGNRKN